MTVSPKMRNAGWVKVIRKISVTITRRLVLRLKTPEPEEERPPAPRATTPVVRAKIGKPTG